MPLTRMKVGFIGLGLMGAPMVRQLLAGNAVVTVYNRTLLKAEQIAKEGARIAASPKEVAQAVGDGFIILCVSDTASLEEALTGEDGVIFGIEYGTTVIDMGSSDVKVTRALAHVVEAAGGRYIDAPVSGGEIGAKLGTLAIMVGGEERDLARAAPLFNVLGSSTTHIGPVGTGQAAKIANQAIVGATICIVAEAFALARAAGADIVQVRKALMGGFAGSRILDLHGQRMIDSAFVPGARATTQLKDMGQALSLAGEVQMSLPFMVSCRDLWAEMADAGLGDLDQAGYFQYVESSNVQG